jgi:hypothetical protein
MILGFSVTLFESYNFRGMKTEIIPFLRDCSWRFRLKKELINYSITTR